MQPMTNQPEFVSASNANIISLGKESLEAEEDDSVFGFGDHVKVNFDGVFSEPESLTSIKNIRIIQRTIFGIIMKVVYNVLAVIVGMPLAFLWAIIFALSNFTVIWFAQPMLKQAFMCMRVFVMIPRVAIRLCCDPLYQSMGLLYSRCRGNFNLNLHGLNLNKCQEFDGNKIQEM